MFISKKTQKIELLTKQEFNKYFYDMLLTIFNAKIKNSKLVFNNNECFEIKAYLEK